MRLAPVLIVLGLGSWGAASHAQAVPSHEPMLPLLSFHSAPLLTALQQQTLNRLSALIADAKPLSTCPMPVLRGDSSADPMPVAKGGPTEPMPVARSGCWNPLDQPHP